MNGIHLKNYEGGGHQTDSRSILYAIVAQGAVVPQQHATIDEAFLVWRNTFLFTDLHLDIVG
jgi:hypothetical protein